MKRPSILTLAMAAALLSAIPVGAYDFQGYYVPQVLVSPMRDNVVYTPAGAGVVTSKAGFRVHPVTGKGDFHNGVDLAANLNDKIYCLLDGQVTRVGWRGAMGVAVEIYHPYPNVRTICGHMNAYAVQPGQWIQRGRVIGYAGSTGRSTGVHVHYTVIKEDTHQYIDPMAFLLQVPQYVMALHNAHVQAQAARNTEVFRKAPPKSLPDEPDDDVFGENKKEEPPPPMPDASISNVDTGSIINPDLP